MGAHLLLIPCLFVAICATFIMIQSCYQKIKMKNALKKKREAAKVSLVNIMQLTNSTLINPTWTKNATGGYVTMEEECEKSEKGCTIHNHNSADSNPSVEAEGKGTLNARDPNILSSVVTLREEQDSPPPYEELYDIEGNPYVIRKMQHLSSACSGIDHSTLEGKDLILPPPEFSSPALTSTGNCRISEEIFPQCHERDVNLNIKGSSQNPCLLQLPQNSTLTQMETNLESDPNLERRNSSAVLYL